MNKDNFKKITPYLFLLFSFSLFLLIFMERDYDYYWHIKTGEKIFHNGIIKNDIFSWTVLGKGWISHEWLFELLLYSISLFLPKTHLLFYGLITIFSLLMILFLSNKNEYLKNTPYTLIWFSFSIIFMSYMQGRPNLLSFILLALTIKFLYNNDTNENSKKIYFLPIISMIWANIHGGSSNLVYLLCLLFYLCSLVELNTTKVISHKRKKEIRKKYLLVLILSMLTININIHGFKMLLYPYQNMLDNTMLQAIEEWTPLNLNNISHYPYILLIVFIFTTFLFSKKKIQLIDLLLFLFSLFLGFKSIRFCSYTYIIMSFIIFKYVSPKTPDKNTNIMIITLSTILLSIFIGNSKTILNNINKNHISSTIIDTLKVEKPQRLFNDYNIGGELIYHNIPVMIDGRADLYSPNILKDYLIINHTSKNYKEKIKFYNFDYYLVDKNSNINYYLSQEENISILIKDTNYILYKKN